MYSEIDDLFPENTDKMKKRKNLLSQLSAMEEEIEAVEGSNQASSNESSTFLPSSFLDSRVKKKKKEEEENDISMDYWMDLSENLKMKKTGRKGKNSTTDLLFGNEKKKKKKKKGKKDNKVDFKQEFEPEIALYTNLLQDQSRFTDSLQKEYDSLRSSKSSARGINKNMSDLIERITGARTLNMQLTEKIVNAKKLVAELTMKQDKELGNNLEGENLGDFASSYLKKMMDERQNYFNGNGTEPGEIVDYQEDDDFYDDMLNEQLSGEERSNDVETQLKYENRNVKVYVHIVNDDIENYEFVAIDEDGNIIPDYPLPVRSSISVNRSTNIATDTYGRKYFIQWN